MLAFQAEPHTMHIWCSWHGGGGAPHFVVNLTKSPTGLAWEYVGSLPGNGNNPSDTQQPGEPTPVYEGGAPGDAATVNYFIVRCFWSPAVCLSNHMFFF